MSLHLHFETRLTKPPVFRMTPEAVQKAHTASATKTTYSLNSNPQDRNWMATATGLITSNDILNEKGFPLRELKQLAPNLRWIHTIAAGVDPLMPLDWLPTDVRLTNNSGVHVGKCRESAIMALLMLNAKLPAITTNQRLKHWQQIFSPSIVNRKLLVVGVGEMGGAVADAGKLLGMQVTGIRRSGGTHPAVSHMARPEDLDRLLPTADFVALAMPLTPETRGLFDARRLGLLKPGAGFLNIGRGSLVDHAALIKLLESGAIGGAVTDVYHPEPPPADSPLWATRNLIMLPHVTSDDENEYLPMTYALVFENAERLAKGLPLKNEIDRQRGY